MFVYISLLTIYNEFPFLSNITNTKKQGREKDIKEKFQI